MPTQSLGNVSQSLRTYQYAGALQKLRCRAKKCGCVWKSRILATVRYGRQRGWDFLQIWLRSLYLCLLSFITNEFTFFLISFKRKLVFKWNDFQKSYKTYDSTSGWSKRWTAYSNHMQNDPTLLNEFFEDLKNKLKNKRKPSNEKAFSFSLLFGVDRLKYKGSPVPIPPKKMYLS